MPAPLYVSKLDQIGEALAARIAAAPVLAAEGIECVSRVDDTIGSVIAERVAKAGGLLCVVALQSVAPIAPDAPGPRIRATWSLSLWARRANREQLNPGPVLFEDLLAQVQGWQPSTSTLCYDEFRMQSGGQVPHPKFSLYEAFFACTVQIAAPTLADP